MDPSPAAQSPRTGSAPLRNALKHGIHSTHIVLPHEDPEAYDQFLATFLDEWQPAIPTEEALVVDMVNARWRLLRIELLVAATIERETENLQDELDCREETMTPETMFARVHARNAIHNANTLETFERWEGRPTAPSSALSKRCAACKPTGMPK